MVSRDSASQEFSWFFVLSLRSLLVDPVCVISSSCLVVTILNLQIYHPVTCSLARHWLISWIVAPCVLCLQNVISECVCTVCMTPWKRVWWGWCESCKESIRHFQSPLLLICCTAASLLPKSERIPLILQRDKGALHPNTVVGSSYWIMQHAAQLRF